MHWRGGFTINKKQLYRGFLCFIFLSVLLFSLLSSSLLAVVIKPNFYFSVGNELYTVNQSMNFESITISTSHIVFNNTGFHVSSGNDITITLVFINDDILNAINGEKVLEFYANTTSGTVWFNLSGFTAGNNYTIKRSGTPIATSLANISGFISFLNNVWSRQRFEILQQAQGGDVTPPEIKDVVMNKSNPIDTQIGFGWENITCTVSDNASVDEVEVRLTYPNSTTTSFGMSNSTTIDHYFYNTTFTQSGNYSFYIWADDNSSNSNTSGVHNFSLPPNWDINNDGKCSVYDYVLISNRYSNTGNQGWIREDVDNNGQIQVLDLVFVSGFYGQIWWV